jgi:hypothetical protein
MAYGFGGAVERTDQLYGFAVEATLSRAGNRCNFVGVLSAGQAEVPGANGSKDARAAGENSGNQHSGFISNDITPPA